MIAHAEVDRLRAPLALDVEHDVQRRDPLLARDGYQVEPHAPRLRCEPGDADRAAASSAVELALDLGADQGTAVGARGQAGELVATDPHRPVGNHHGAQPGARSNVRILIGGDHLPCVPRGLDPLERQDGLSPVGLAIGLQV
jgi:hypothetical protein